MGYLVLARKWRPQTWDEVVAQQHVTATLRNAIQLNRIAHAYLLAGPRGVGKTSAARIMAKALNCEKGPGPDPCNACSACLEITGGRSMDVIEIDGASNRGIEDIRSLRETVRYAPTRGRYKVYIIDEVHMLTTEAFNALLKTLEEPPEHVLFLFATTEPHKVPATILSRCQRFDFHRVAVPDMVDLLGRICKSEAIDIDDEALHLIARKADGSLRDSQSILDQMVSFASGPIRAADVISALGLIDQQLFFEMTDAVAARNAAQGLDLVDKLVASGTSIEEFMDGLLGHFRDLLVVRAAGGAGVLDVSEANRKRFEEKAAAFREEDLLRLIRVVADAQLQVKFSDNPRIPLELAVIKMSKIDKTASIQDLLAQLGDLKKNPPEQAVRRTEAAQSGSTGNEAAPRPIMRPKAAAPVPTPAQTQTPAPAPARAPVTAPAAVSAPAPTTVSAPQSTSAGTGTLEPVTLKEFQERWEDLIALVKKKKITLGAFLAEGAPIQVRNGAVEIGFAPCNGFHVDSIMRAQAIITESLKEIFGRDVPFKCVKGDFPQVRRTSEKERKIETIKALKEGGMIQKLIDDFDVDVES
jgi:DNA polymerase III subunit gamma/tau